MPRTRAYVAEAMRHLAAAEQEVPDYAELYDRPAPQDPSRVRPSTNRPREKVKGFHSG